MSLISKDSDDYFIQTLIFEDSKQIDAEWFLLHDAHSAICGITIDSPPSICL